MKKIAIITEGGLIDELIASEETEVIVVDRDVEDVECEDLKTVLGRASYIYNGINSAEVNQQKLKRIAKETGWKTKEKVVFDNKNNNSEYYNEAIELYKHLLRKTASGTMHHLENIFKDEQLQDKLLDEVCSEDDAKYANQ